MAQVFKGEVMEVLENGAIRIKDLHTASVMPVIFETEYTLSVGEYVAFSIFGDGTGVILQRIRGEMDGNNR